MSLSEIFAALQSNAAKWLHDVEARLTSTNRLALLALALTVVTSTCNGAFSLWNAGFSLYVLRIQDDKWQEEKGPRVTIKQGKFVEFAEGDDRLRKTLWFPGYTPFIVQDTAAKINVNGILGPTYKLNTTLVFWDSVRQEPISGTQFMQTESEVKSEAQRAGLKVVQLRKHLRLIVPVVNVGELVAEDVTIEVLDLRRRAAAIIPMPDLYPEGDDVIQYDMYEAIELSDKTRLRFELRGSFVFQGKRQEIGLQRWTYYPEGQRWEREFISS